MIKKIKKNQKNACNNNLSVVLYMSADENSEKKKPNRCAHSSTG